MGYLRDSHRIVVKVGTSTLTHHTGHLNLRRIGVLVKVLSDMKNHGLDTLYMLTDHDSFYERYGWQYLCEAQGDGEPQTSRMYIKKL